MFEYTEYELNKKQKKRELVRNDLPVVGKYQFPIIKSQSIDLDKIDLISYANIKNYIGKKKPSLRMKKI